MLYTKKISDQSLLDRFHSLSFTMMVLWHEIVLLNFQSICEAEFFIERFFKWSFYFRLLFLKYFFIRTQEGVTSKHFVGMCFANNRSEKRRQLLTQNLSLVIQSKSNHFQKIWKAGCEQKLSSCHAYNILSPFFPKHTKSRPSMGGLSKSWTHQLTFIFQYWM